MATAAAAHAHAAPRTIGDAWARGLTRSRMSTIVCFIVKNPIGFMNERTVSTGAVAS